jgi:cytochrome c-type biogenesis protein CcmE
VSKRKTKLIVVMLVVTAAVGYLVYSGIRETMVYYLTVSELIQQTPSTSEEGVRVGGKVLEGSVTWDPKALKLKFVLGDKAQSLPVVYEGVVPDSFKQGQEVIIEGRYAGPMFVASQIMPTCPSKYE